MKPIQILFILLLPIALLGQDLSSLNYVGNLSDGYAPVKKSEKWGFINEKGELSVDFREDLVENKKISGERDLGVATLRYPKIQENRAIIKENKHGINYYGFIDGSGQTVIAPEFLNVSSFNNGKALALKLEGRELGRNDVLGKRQISYRYDVVVIDTTGAVQKYLSGPFPVSVSKEKLREAPPITARILGENLISVRGPDKLWEIYNLEE